MANDKFNRNADNVDSPARAAFAVVPHDGDELPLLPKALLVGGAGAIALRAADSAADVIVQAVAGQVIPIRARFVRATGTTATQIVALA